MLKSGGLIETAPIQKVYPHFRMCCLIIKEQSYLKTKNPARGGFVPASLAKVVLHSKFIII